MLLAIVHRVLVVFPNEITSNSVSELQTFLWVYFLRYHGNELRGRDYQASSRDQKCQRTARQWITIMVIYQHSHTAPDHLVVLGSNPG